MGAGLAAFHAATAGRFDAPGFLREGREGALRTEGTLAVDARDSWHATLLDLVADYRDWLDDADVPGDHAALAGEVRDALRSRPFLFEGAGEPVLVHGNWLPDHVGVAGSAGCHRPPAGCPRDLRPLAVADGEITGVVDFEHALVGPGEYDLLRATLPLEASEGSEVATAFREGYESIRPLAPGRPDAPGFETRRPAHRLVLSVSYLQSLYLQRGPLDSREELAERAERIHEHVRADLDRLPDPD